MRRLLVLVFALSLLTSVALAAKKESGSTTLKNVQPAGTTDKKQHKKQQYDLTFASANNEYTCRTNEKEKVNATNWVVGSSINYQVKGNKGEVKNLQSGKSAKCTVVRVAGLTANPQ